MPIRFACRNGHLLKTEEHHAGRRTRCPRCRATVVVPPLGPRSTVTDTEAMRIVGNYAPRDRGLSSALSPDSPATERTCPNCRSHMSALLRICPHCQVYVGAVQ